MYLDDTHIDLSDTGVHNTADVYLYLYLCVFVYLDDTDDIDLSDTGVHLPPRSDLCCLPSERYGWALMAHF